MIRGRTWNFALWNSLADDRRSDKCPAFSRAASQIHLSDDFDSCPGDVALASVWSRVATSAGSLALAADPTIESNQVILQTTAAGRLRHVVEEGLPPAAAGSIAQLSAGAKPPSVCRHRAAPSATASTEAADVHH